MSKLFCFKIVLPDMCRCKYTHGFTIHSASFLGSRGSQGVSTSRPNTLRSFLNCRYDFFLQSPLLGAMQLEAEFDWGGTHIWVSTCVVQGLRCFFIEPANGFFAVDSVYGRADDAKRFDFFNKVRPALPYDAETLCHRLQASRHAMKWDIAATAADFVEITASFSFWCSSRLTKV